MATPFEEGNPDSKLLILGQAPSYMETRHKRPLVGPAGYVFGECMGTANISRRECYILNVWEMEVITDDYRGTIHSKRGGELLWTKKGFTEAGLDAASGAISRIVNSGANCILALGQQAFALCTGKSDRILKWRGSILPGDDRINGRKVVGTIHPSACLRGNYLWRYLIINDMKRVREERESPKIVLPERNIILTPSLADIREYMELCRDHGQFATDLEVINHQVSCFSLAPSVSEAMVVPLTNEYGDAWTEEEECEIWEMYNDIMSDPDVEKVNQNLIGFDAPFLLMQNHIHTQGTMRDNMIAQSVLYPEFNKGLDFQASVYTREPYFKDEGKMWKNEGGDFPTFWRYNGKDACVSLECWNVLAQELTQRAFWATYDRHETMAQVLMYMTIRGLRVDLETLNETNANIGIEINEKMDRLNEVAEYPFNPTSPKSCQDYFYGAKGLPAYKNKAGRPTTDDKAMSRIFRKTGLVEAKLVQEIRALKKLKGTYLEVEVDPDNRLRCSWNPRGTKFGRLSSSKTLMGRGMNLQNLHPKFKRFIVADEVRPDGFQFP